MEVKENANRISTKNSRRITENYRLIFDFKKKDASNVVEILLTTKNNSYCGDGYMFHDGERYEIFANQGESKLYKFHPENSLFNLLTLCLILRMNPVYFHPTFG